MEQWRRVNLTAVVPEDDGVTVRTSLPTSISPLSSSLADRAWRSLLHANKEGISVPCLPMALCPPFANTTPSQRGLNVNDHFN